MSRFLSELRTYLDSSLISALFTRFSFFLVFLSLHFREPNASCCLIGHTHLLSSKDFWESQTDVQTDEFIMDSEHNFM